MQPVRLWQCLADFLRGDLIDTAVVVASTAGAARFDFSAAAGVGAAALRPSPIDFARADRVAAQFGATIGHMPPSKARDAFIIAAQGKDVAELRNPAKSPLGLERDDRSLWASYSTIVGPTHFRLDPAESVSGA